MKKFGLLSAGLVAAPCVISSDVIAMEVDIDNIFEKENMTDYFKSHIEHYNWLSPVYKELFLNLPSSSEFITKWNGHKEKLIAENSLSDNEIATIQNKAKNIFKKYLGQNALFYRIVCNVIDTGRYYEGVNFYDLANSELFMDLDYIYNIREIQYKAYGNHSNKMKMIKTAKNQLHDILLRYATKLTYRKEKADDLNLVDKPKEYERQIFEKYKDALCNFATKYISVNFFDTVVLTKMQKNYSYDLYREILNEVKEKCCTLHKKHKDKIDEVWCECEKNFCLTHKIVVKYRGSENLLSTMMHETGHAVADAKPLIDNDDKARVENIEAIATYFELLTLKEQEFKDYKFTKLERIYPLYVDLASIISLGVLEEEGADISTFITLPDMKKSERIKLVSQNKELCERAVEVYKTLYEKIDPEIAFHKFKLSDEEKDMSKEEYLANKLMEIYDQFDLDTSLKNIEFSFSAHTKALFHALKIDGEATLQKWDIGKILDKLSKEQMTIPTLEEFKQALDWAFQ
ncbi:MAG: hypothetical protein IJS10_02480 [Alphaproteobacteria bacterium]|nr:hypothetical protein [Alphaproteobacteria bacterium]